jgi:hypothetical protein
MIAPSIAGAATSITAFVGPLPQGSQQAPVAISLEHERTGVCDALRVDQRGAELDRSAIGKQLAAFR